MVKKVAVKTAAKKPVAVLASPPTPAPRDTTNEILLRDSGNLFRLC